MKYFIICAIAFLGLGCRAQFSSVGFKTGPGPVDPKPEPPPPVWPDGPLKVSCGFQMEGEMVPIVEAGVVDAKSGKFITKSYNYIKFADEGWISAEITFPGYDSSKFPEEKPLYASVEYYLFLRPDWHTPLDYYEIRRVRVGDFNDGKAIRQGWKFISHKLICKTTRSSS